MFPIQISMGDIMKDYEKTKRQFVIELTELRSQCAALAEIEKNKGTYYDNTVADACLRLFR